MKWDELTSIQKNALVAEKVEGWQWIPFDFDDVYPMKDQLWLLPDALATHDLTPGEWTWYLEEEQIYPEGSLFPLPHKDKRIIPTWLPYYTESMNAAWEIVEKLYEQYNVQTYMDSGLLDKYEVNVFVRDDVKLAGSGGSDTSMSEAICKAALRVYGVKIE